MRSTTHYRLTHAGIQRMPSVLCCAWMCVMITFVVDRELRAEAREQEFFFDESCPVDLEGDQPIASMYFNGHPLRLVASEELERARPEIFVVNTQTAQPSEQDAVPVPPPDESEQQPLLDQPAPTRLAEPAANGPVESNAEASERPERLGEAPPDEGLYFLRQQTVLLSPGNWQFDVGVSYALYDRDFAIGGDELQYKQRYLLVPTELRYGLTPCMQGYIYVPFGLAHTELSFTGLDEFSSQGGIGDIHFGVTRMLRPGCGYSPQVIGTFDVTAPTGNAEVAPTLLGLPPASLGEGYWAVAGNILFIHTYDPVVVFYGAGMRHRFDRDFDGVEFDPGEEFTYQLGVGFGINERVTLSTQLLGSYINELRLDDLRIPGTILEPMRMRFAVTVTRPSSIVEPFAEIGMTEEAPAGRLGITWTF